MKCPTCNHDLPSEGIFIDVGDGVVIVDGVPSHHMGPVSMKIARYFIDRMAQPISREHVLDSVYGNRIDGGPYPKSIDVMVFHLRKALEPTNLRVETVWGVGWRVVRDRGVERVPFKERPDGQKRRSARSTTAVSGYYNRLNRAP